MDSKDSGSARIGSLRRHALSIAAVAILIAWIALYSFANPQTHWGSFFGNAIADWTGVLVAVVATKYFYEIGSAKSNQPQRRFQSPLLEKYETTHSRYFSHSPASPGFCSTPKWIPNRSGDRL